MPLKLLQGYLWHPKEAALDLKALLPKRLGEAHLLLDQVPPPVAFFDDGTPTAGQRFYQLTLLLLEDPPDPKAKAQEAAQALEPLLQALPPGVGWLILEDLRPL